MSIKSEIQEMLKNGATMEEALQKVADVANEVQAEEDAKAAASAKNAELDALAMNAVDATIQYINARFGLELNSNDLDFDIAELHSMMDDLEDVATIMKAFKNPAVKVKKVTVPKKEKTADDAIADFLTFLGL